MTGCSIASWMVAIWTVAALVIVSSDCDGMVAALSVVTPKKPLRYTITSTRTSSTTGTGEINRESVRRLTALHSSAAAAASAPENRPKQPQPFRPRKVCLMVEPTPFTHVSGYANRFKEMLKFLKKAGDDVDILTVDSKTPAQDLPTEYQGYPVRHTQGFTFPLYNHISLTMDLPEMKGARIMETFRPDLIHVTSPGFLLFAAMFYARVMKIPLVMSYHTHLPTYGKCDVLCWCCCVFLYCISLGHGFEY